MLNLSIFSPYEIRRFKDLLTLFEPSATVKQITAELDKSYAEQEAVFYASPLICPSCGVGHMSILSTIEGLKRRGCRRCYYSEVV